MQQAHGKARLPDAYRLEDAAVDHLLIGILGVELIGRLNGLIHCLPSQ